MKLETSERILVETLLEESIDAQKISLSQPYRIIKLTGDASTRRYYRVQGESESFVVCLDTPKSDLDESDFIKMQKCLSQEGVRVPKIFDMDSARGYYLEEDLGDRTFLQHLSYCENRKDELIEYEKAINLLISIHKIDLAKYPDAIFNTRAFDLEKLMYEVRFTFQQFIEGLMNFAPTGYPQVQMQAEFSRLCLEICKGPWVLTHRDYHSRNIMVLKDEFILIDFQDARRGLPAYDLASVLEDCYYELSHDNHQKLMNQYWEGLGKELYKNDRMAFERHYRLMAVQRIFKAIGSFAFIYRQRGDIRYLRHIGRAFERLKAILFELEDFQELRKSLSSLYYAY